MRILCIIKSIIILVKVTTRRPIMMGILLDVIRIYWFVHFQPEIFLSVLSGNSIRIN